MFYNRNENDEIIHHVICSVFVISSCLVLEFFLLI
jgi:hypothetical protein